MPQVLYLSRKNLLELLKALDNGDGAKPLEAEQHSYCMVKRDLAHKDFPSTDIVFVFPVEDEDYYKDRPPGQRYKILGGNDDENK